MGMCSEDTRSASLDFTRVTKLRTKESEVDRMRESRPLALPNKCHFGGSSLPKAFCTPSILSFVALFSPLRVWLYAITKQNAEPV